MFVDWWLQSLLPRSALSYLPGWLKWVHICLLMTPEPITKVCTKLPTKLFEMSACLLADVSRAFYQELHEATNQIGWNECMFVDWWLQNLLPRSALSYQPSWLKWVHVGWLMTPEHFTNVCTKLPTILVEMTACLLTDDSRVFYQGLH